MDVPDFPVIVELAVPFFIGAMILEILVGKWTGKASYETRDTMASLIMGGGNLVEGMTLGLLGLWCLNWVFVNLAPVHLSFSAPVILLAFVLDDLRYYWIHRISHECRWWWGAHVTHHSSQHYNLSTALRQSWGLTISGWFLSQLPLAFLGFHPAVLGLCAGISLVYQFWIHTEAIGRFPRWFAAVFNTPSHHRVHHAVNPNYLDRNYAGTLIIWDRLFGSFEPENDEDKPRYGLVHNLDTFNPLRIAGHVWMTMARDVVQPGLTARDRFLYVFGPPGWSHDGSRKTSADLKREHALRQAR